MSLCGDTKSCRNLFTSAWMLACRLHRPSNLRRSLKADASSCLKHTDDSDCKKFWYRHKSDYEHEPELLRAQCHLNWACLPMVQSRCPFEMGVDMTQQLHLQCRPPVCCVMSVHISNATTWLTIGKQAQMRWHWAFWQWLVCVMYCATLMSPALLPLHMNNSS